MSGSIEMGIVGTALKITSPESRIIRIYSTCQCGIEHSHSILPAHFINDVQYGRESVIFNIPRCNPTNFRFRVIPFQALKQLVDALPQFCLFFKILAYYVSIVMACNYHYQVGIGRATGCGDMPQATFRWLS